MVGASYRDCGEPKVEEAGDDEITPIIGVSSALVDLAINGGSAAPQHEIRRCQYALADRARQMAGKTWS